jgi:hypothetical protein
VSFYAEFYGTVGAPTGGGGGPAPSGEFRTLGAHVIKPDGTVFHGAGMNAAFNLIGGPFVFQGFPNTGTPCDFAFDTPASRAAGCLYQGGGISGTIPVWDPLSNGNVLLPDRWYAINGYLSATAAARGATAPPDNWRQRLLRATMVAAGASGPYPLEMGGLAIGCINEGLPSGAVIVPEFHDLTGKNLSPPAAYNAVGSAFGTGFFADTVNAWDVVIPAYRTNGNGGTTPTAQGYVWLGDTNEPFGNVADGNGNPPASYFAHQLFWIKRIRLYHGAENIILFPLSEWGQDLHGVATGKYDAFFNTLKNDPSGDLSRNLVLSWHNYGAKGLGVAYDYATMDADLNTVTRLGTPGGWKFPVFVGEYGRPKDGVNGDAGPTPWNITGFECLMTSKFGTPLAVKYSDSVFPCVWIATGDTGYEKSRYALTLGTGINDFYNGLGQPFWQIASGSDIRLTEMGAAHWSVAHQLWNLG